LSTKALLAQQQREREQAAEKAKEEALKEKAPEVPEPSRKKKR
jgi:hypothetical protein